MNWLVIALIAPAIYAVVNFIDKYLLSKEIKDYNAMPIYTALVGLLGGTIYWFLSGFPILPFKDAALVLLTGFLTAWSLISYFKALSETETSKVIILFQMFPLITLILSLLFLKETISLRQFFGFLIVLSAAMIVAVEKEEEKFKLSKAFYYILIYDVLWATSGVIMKYALGINNFSQVISYESWGIFLGGLTIYLIIPKIRKAFNKDITQVKARALFAIGLNEVTFLVAKSLTFFAFSLGPVALVSVLENTQIFYGILYGFILSTVAPKIFKEDTSRSNLVKKFVLGSVLIIGITML